LKTPHKRDQAPRIYVSTPHQAPPDTSCIAMHIWRQKKSRHVIVNTIPIYHLPPPPLPLSRWTNKGLDPRKTSTKTTSTKNQTNIQTNFFLLRLRSWHTSAHVALGQWISHDLRLRAGGPPQTSRPVHRYHPASSLLPQSCRTINRPPPRRLLSSDSPSSNILSCSSHAQIVIFLLGTQGNQLSALRELYVKIINYPLPLSFFVRSKWDFLLFLCCLSPVNFYSFYLPFFAESFSFL